MSVEYRGALWPAAADSDSPETVETSSVRLCDARLLGLSRGELRSERWDVVSHGVYVEGPKPSDSAALFRAVRCVLPDNGTAAHLTAAQLYGLWLPAQPRWLPMLASLPPGQIRPERAGLYVFRSRGALPDAVTVGGIPCVPPEVAIGQLAEDLGLLDLVVAIDSALHGRLCTMDSITANIRSRQRGLPNLRRALRLCDGRSESPWESVLRVLFVVAGIEVIPQAPIQDEAGEVVARGDLKIAGTRRLAEYDGAVHRDGVQHQADLRREKMLQRLGYQRFGYVAADIREHPARILRDAESALGRTSPATLEKWWPLYHGSSIGPEGYRRLLHRLHRFDRPLRARLARTASSADSS